MALKSRAELDRLAKEVDGAGAPRHELESWVHQYWLRLKQTATNCGTTWPLQGLVVPPPGAENVVWKDVRTLKP